MLTSSSRGLARESRILETRWHVWWHQVHGKRKASTESWSWRGNTYVIIPTSSLVVVVIIRALVALFTVGFVGVVGGSRTFRAAGICRETFADGYKSLVSIAVGGLDGTGITDLSKKHLAQSQYLAPRQSSHPPTASHQCLHTQQIPSTAGPRRSDGRLG